MLLEGGLEGAHMVSPGGGARVLAPGDWIHIPARARHRVEWTDTAEPTLWLAVHHQP